MIKHIASMHHEKWAVYVNYGQSFLTTCTLVSLWIQTQTPIDSI